LEKTAFLLRVEHVENSDEMTRFLKTFRGRGNQLQERMGCLVQTGLDYNVVSSFIKQVPMVPNQTKHALEKKIDCMTNFLGYSVNSLEEFPAYLCYDFERVKLRFRMYIRLREKGAAKPKVSMGTILACSCAICKTLCRCPLLRTSYVGKFKECISFKPRLVLHLNCAQFICIVSVKLMPSIHYHGSNR
jgi:hypothetical protein